MNHGLQLHRVLRDTFSDHAAHFSLPFCLFFLFLSFTTSYLSIPSWYLTLIIFMSNFLDKIAAKHNIIHLSLLHIILFVRDSKIVLRGCTQILPNKVSSLKISRVIKNIAYCLTLGRAHFASLFRFQSCSVWSKPRNANTRHLRDTSAVSNDHGSTLLSNFLKMTGRLLPVAILFLSPVYYVMRYMAYMTSLISHQEIPWWLAC